MGVHLIGHNRRLEVSTGHGPHDVENFEGRNRDGAQHHDDGVPDHRNRNFEEAFHLASTVEHRCFDDLVGDCFHRCRQNHHGETALNPDHHDHQEERIKRRFEEPVGWLTPEPFDDGAQNPDFSAVRVGFKVIDELPDDARTHKGNRHRQKDQRLHNGCAPHPVGHEGDQEPHKGRQDGHNDDPQQCVAKHQQEFGAGENKNVVGQANEFFSPSIKEGQPDGANGRIDEANDQQERCRPQKNNVFQPGLNCC